MFYGSNPNQSQQTNVNLLNPNTGFNNIANTGYVNPYGSFQQISTPGITPFGGFDSNDDFGSYLVNQYGEQYVNFSMKFNGLDQQTEPTSAELDMMYKPYGREADYPDDHVNPCSFEDTTIINIAYKRDFGLDDNRWDFYRKNRKEIRFIQREISRSSGSTDQSTSRSTTTGFTQSNDSFFGVSIPSASTQPASNTGFGQTSSTLFGQPTTNTGFGQSNTSVFGQTTTNTGFGQPSTIGFGQTNNTPLLQTNTTGFGQTSTTSGFGQTPTINNFGFGQPTTNTCFGQTSSINTGFGQPSSNTLLGQPNNNLFGQPTTNTAFGQSGINTGFGQTNVGTTVFGQPSINTGFGQSASNFFTQPSTNTVLGQTNTSLFGQPTPNTTVTQGNINNTGFGQVNTNTGFGQTGINTGFGQTSTTSGFGQTSINTGFGQTSINTGLGQPSSNLFGQPSTTTTTGLGQTTTMGFSQPVTNTGFGQTNLNTPLAASTTTNTGFGQSDFTNTTLGQTVLNTNLGQTGINTGLNNTFGQPNNTPLGQPNTTTGVAQPTVINTGSGQTTVIDSGANKPSTDKDSSVNTTMFNGSSLNTQPVNVSDSSNLQTKIQSHTNGSFPFLDSLIGVEAAIRASTQSATNGTSNQFGASVTNKGHVGSLNGSGLFTNSANQRFVTFEQALKNPADAEIFLRTKTLAEQVKADLLIFDRHMMEDKLEYHREFKRMVRRQNNNWSQYLRHQPYSSRDNDINKENEYKLSEKESKSDSNKQEKLYLLKPPYGPTPKEYIIESFRLQAEQQKAEEEKADREIEEREEMSDPLLSCARYIENIYGKNCEDPNGELSEGHKEMNRNILKKAEEKRAMLRKKREESYCNTYEELFEKIEEKMKTDKNFFQPDSTWNWDDPLSNLDPKETKQFFDTDNEEQDEDDEFKDALEEPEDLANPKAPMLLREEYTTRPHIRTLMAMTDEELSQVKDFQISRDGYGDILFPGLTDLRGLDLDDIVEIGYRKVSVYGGKTKAPEPGQGLNKKAFISMYNCTPKENERTKYTSKTTHELMMEKYTIMLGCKFLDMNYELGSWMFETPYFVGKEEGRERDGRIVYYNSAVHEEL